MFEDQPILIVEDEPLLALDLADLVTALDGRVVGPFALVSEALRRLEGEEVAAAIVDVQLADRDITPVAVHLARAGIPFIVHTGTGLPAEVALAWPELTVLRKPIQARVLAECLRAEMHRFGRLRG